MAFSYEDHLFYGPFQSRAKYTEGIMVKGIFSIKAFYTKGILFCGILDWGLIILRTFSQGIMFKGHIKKGFSTCHPIYAAGPFLKTALWNYIWRIPSIHLLQFSNSSFVLFMFCHKICIHCILQCSAFSYISKHNDDQIIQQKGMGMSYTQSQNVKKKSKIGQSTYWCSI